VEAYLRNKRRNIKKAFDRGVEFIETSSFEDVEKFYGLFLDLAKRHKFVPAPLFLVSGNLEFAVSERLVKTILRQLEG